MELVVDANILVAGSIRAAVTRELLHHERLSLWTPESGLTESMRVLASPEFRRRFGEKSAAEPQFILDQLTAKIRVVPLLTIKHLRSEALQLAPHPEDAPYLALAMHLHIALWSNDAGLKRQNIVPVYATHELLKLIS